MKLQAVLISLALGLGCVKASLDHSAGNLFSNTTKQQHYEELYQSYQDKVNTLSSSEIEAKEQAAQQESSVVLPKGQKEASLFYPINPPSIPLAVKGPCECNY
jgi:nitrate reductase cytochrome c-type subunit